MDRHHQQEARHPVRTSSPLMDVDSRSPNASHSLDHSFCGHTGVRGPPLEQPLDFSLKSAAASSSSSPLSSEDDRRPSPDCVALGAARSHPEASNPLSCPESHQRNLPSLLIPRTATNTSASTSPPAPFQNGYANGYAGARGPLQGLQNSLMTSLRSPPRSNLSVSPAPPLVRPPPQQPAFPSLRSPPLVNAPTSPQPSVPSQTGKYVRPFKAYKPGDLLPMSLYSVPSQFFPAAPAAAAGFRLADPGAEPEFAAYCKRLLWAAHANGRQERQRRRSRPAASAAAGSARQLSSTSPPPLSNGAATACRADSGEEGSTSPENSDSSILAVPNGDASNSGPVTNGGSVTNGAASTSGPVANGGTTTNGGAPTANGDGDVVAANGGQPNGAPSAANDGGPVRNGRRRHRLPDRVKDQAYWERRRKNNEAAKRSRDARRLKEDAIAIRCAFLQDENTRLHYEIAGLRKELNDLRRAVYPFSQ